MFLLASNMLVATGQSDQGLFIPLFTSSMALALNSAKYRLSLVLLMGVPDPVSVLPHCPIFRKPTIGVENYLTGADRGARVFPRGPLLFLIV